MDIFNESATWILKHAKLPNFSPLYFYACGFRAAVVTEKVKSGRL